MSIKSHLPKASSVLLVLVIAAPIVLIWFRIIAMNRAENARIEKLKQWTIAPRPEWPMHIAQLIREADRSQIQYGELTVFNRPYYRDFCWAFDYSPELLELMKKRFELTRVEEGHKRAWGALDHLPSDLQSLGQAGDLEYYVGNQEYLEYGEGPFYCVLVDTPQKKIVTKYYYEYYQVGP
jgi:hypothetical protein